MTSEDKIAVINTRIKEWIAFQSGSREMWTKMTKLRRKGLEDLLRESMLSLKEPSKITSWVPDTFRVRDEKAAQVWYRGKRCSTSYYSRQVNKYFGLVMIFKRLKKSLHDNVIGIDIIERGGSIRYVITREMKTESKMRI